MKRRKISISIFNNKIRMAIILCTGTFYCSCVSLKTPERVDLIPLQAPMSIGEYPTVINRIIKSKFSKDTVIPTVVWYYFKNSSSKDSLELAEATHMELTLIDEKHVTATLYNKSISLKTEILKGRLRKGYFRRKHNLSLSGIPPFYWSMTSSKMQVGIGRGKQLFIDTANETNGSILIVGASTPGFTHTLTVPRLHQEK